MSRNATAVLGYGFMVPKKYIVDDDGIDDDLVLPPHQRAQIFEHGGIDSNKFILLVETSIISVCDFGSPVIINQLILHEEWIKLLESRVADLKMPQQTQFNWYLGVRYH
jgi:hypothetical protein